MHCFVLFFCEYAQRAPFARMREQKWFFSRACGIILHVEYEWSIYLNIEAAG
jgi:hypothetical protein